MRVDMLGPAELEDSRARGRGQVCEVRRGCARAREREGALDRRQEQRRHTACCVIAAARQLLRSARAMPRVRRR
jgi:hypothetical protein